MISKTASPLRKGFKYQDIVALKLSLESYIQNEKYELLLEYKEAGSFDDILIIKNDSVNAFQVKHAVNDNDFYNLNDFTDPKSKVHFKKFSDSWLKLRELYPSKKLYINLFTNRALDGEILKVIEAEGFFIDKFIQGGQYKRPREIRNELKEVTKLEEENFQEFLSCFKFQINEPNVYNMENYIQVNLLDYQLGLSNRSIYQQLLSIIEKYEIDDFGSLNNEFIDKILKEVQKKYLLPQKFEFDKNSFVERNELKDKLDKSLKEVNGDYIIVTGPPGSGKSTSLTAYFDNLEKNSDNKVIKYYSFVDINDNQGNLRLEAKSLRVNILSLINDQFGKLLKRRFDYSEENFYDILKELGKHFEEKNQKLIIFVDGIDHAERMESAIQENLVKSLPKTVPKGIVIVLGTQELHNWGPFLIKARENDINHIKMPLFTFNQTKNYLIDKKYLNLSEEQIQKIYNKSEGLPLYLRYISELIENSNDVDSDLKNIPVLPEGNIKTYYEILWNEFYDNGKTRHLCGVLACLRFPITKGEIFNFQNFMSYPDFDDCFSNIKHLLTYMDTDNRIQIFHNSFREFILSNLDDNWKKDIYKDIANNLKSEPGTDLWFGYVFDYAYIAEDFDYILNNVNREFVDFALEKYRSDQDIKNAINWAIKSAKQKYDILSLSRLGALKSRTEYRLEYNLNRNLLSKVLLCMGKEEDVKNYSYSLNHNKWLIDTNTSLKLIKELAEQNKIEIGKELLTIFRESKHGEKLNNEEFLEYSYCLGIYSKAFKEILEFLSQVTIKKGLTESEDPFVPEYAPHLEKYLEAIVKFHPEFLKNIEKENKDYFSSELISYLIIRALFLHEDKKQLKNEINNHISLYKPKSNPELAFYAAYAGLSSKIISKLLGEISFPPLEGLKSIEYIHLLNEYRMIFCTLSYIDDDESLKNLEKFLKTEKSWCRSYLTYLLLVGECLGKHWSQKDDDWFKHAIDSLDILLKIQQGKGERIIWLIRDCREELKESLFLLTKAITEKYPEKLNEWFKKIELLQKSKLWTLNYGLGESIDDYIFELKIYEKLSLINQCHGFIMEILKLCETKFNNSTLLKGESRSEHFMRLSLIATLCNFKNDAEKWLKFAIKATLTYGYRKDTTLFQLINIMKLVNDIEPHSALKRCSEILEMVDWIPHVTDEKNIKHLPQTIFEQVTKNNKEAALELLRIYGNNKPAWKMQDCLEIYIKSIDNGDTEILWSLTSIFANYFSEDFEHPQQVINAKKKVIEIVEKSEDVNVFNNYKNRLNHYIRTNITRRHWPRLISEYWNPIDIYESNSKTEENGTDNKEKKLFLEGEELEIHLLKKQMKNSFEDYKKIITKLKDENKPFHETELEYSTLKFHICENRDPSILLSIKNFLKPEFWHENVETHRELGYKLIDIGEVNDGIDCLETAYKEEHYYAKKRDDDFKTIAKYDKKRAMQVLVETCYEYLIKYGGYDVPRLVSGAYYVLNDFENLNKTYLDYLNYCKELFEQLKKESEYDWLKNYSNKDNINELSIHFLIDMLKTPEIDLGNRLVDTCRNLCLEKPKIAIPIIIKRLSTAKGLIKFRLSIIVDMIAFENSHLFTQHSDDISKLLDSEHFQLKIMAIKILEKLDNNADISNYVKEKLKSTKYAYSQDFSSFIDFIYIPSNEFMDFFQEVSNYLIYEKIRACTEFINYDLILILGEIEYRLKKEGWNKEECYDKLKSEKSGYTHAQGVPFIPTITTFDLKIINIFNQILDEIIENDKLNNNKLEGLWGILQFHDSKYKLSNIEIKPKDIKSLVVKDKKQWLSELDNSEEIIYKSLDHEWITLFERRIISQDETFNVPYYSESLIISSLIKKELFPSLNELKNKFLNFDKIKEFNEDEFITQSQAQNIFRVTKSSLNSNEKFLPILMLKVNSPFLLKYIKDIIALNNFLLTVKMKMDELLFGYPEIILLEKEFSDKYHLDYNNFNAYDGTRIVVKYNNWQEGYEDESTSRDLLSYGVRLQIHKSLLKKIFKDYNVNLCQYNLEKRLYFRHRNLFKASEFNNNTYFVIYSG